MCNEVITLVPERPLRRRITRFLFSLVAITICLVCIYAFGVGQLKAFQTVQPPRPVVSPLQQRQQKATPKVAEDNCRRELRRGFKIGQAVARLERALEATESPR